MGFYNMDNISGMEKIYRLRILDVSDKSPE